jgi:hypothetical protein
MPPPPIDHDLPCAICDYNLKGLAPDANCPECGPPVARTFTAELAQSDPAWLRFQARSMVLLVAFVLVNHVPYVGRLGGTAVWTALSIVATLVAAWGCWRLATPEPASPPDHGHAFRQRALRLAAVVLALFIVGMHVRALLHPALVVSVALGAVVCLVAATALVGLFLRDLARRSRDRSLLLHARIVLWAFPLTQVGELLGQFLVGLFARGEDPPGDWVYLIPGALNYAVGLAAYAAVLLLGRTHEVLRAAAHLADARVASSEVQAGEDSPVAPIPPSATV